MVVRVTLSLNVLVCALAGLIMNFPVCVTIIASVCTATLLLSAQHQFLAAFASLLLGELGQPDHEALDLDTHFEGFSFWWNVCSVHFAGMPYFMRLLWQFGLRRLSRIPRGRVALWPSLRPSQKVRLGTFTGVVTLVQLLTIAYMVSDDQGNEVAQSMLVMDGTVVLLSFVFELVIQACAALSNDWQQKEMARPGDIPYCALQLLRSTLGLSLSVASFSLHGGVLSNAPWIVQAYLARRLWLVVSHHRVLLRSRTVLLGVEDSFEEGMCVICLESLNKTEPAKRLACGHSFHSTCLRRWLTEARTCPTCRVVLAYLEGTTPVPPSNHRLVRLEADSDNGPHDDEPVSPRSLSAAASPNRLRQDFFPGMETSTSAVATDAPYPVASPVSSQGGGSMSLYQLDSSRTVATWPPEHRQRLFVRLMRQRRRRPRRARDAETQVSDSDFTESQVASPVGMPTGDSEAFEPLVELPPKRNRSEHPSASSAA